VSILKKFIGENGDFRAFVVDTTTVGRDLFSRLQPYPAALNIVTQAMTGALLMAADLKRKGTISIKATGSGPLGHVTAEANSQGEARGYCGVPQLVLEKKGEMDLFWRAIQDGELSVRKRFIDSDKVFSSFTKLAPGGWAENLTRFYQESEQVSSGMKLGVDLDAEHGIAGAGGVLIMALPQAESEVLTQLEKNIQKMEQLGQLFRGPTPHESVVDRLFDGLKVKELQSVPVCYRCNCSHEKVADMLKSLAAEEKNDMLEKGEPIQVNCAFCSKSYEFDPKALFEK